MVGLRLFRVAVRSPQVAECEVVDKGIVIAAVEVKAHVSQLVKETEPEVVDAVVP